MGERPVIIGVDPGTTVGISILDIDGKLVNVFSAKDLGVNRTISHIMSFGTTVSIGCDKVKIPDFVKTVATKLGVPVASPAEDILVDDKFKICHRFRYKNSHERDAIVSSLVAYDKIKVLLKKISSFVEHNRLKYDNVTHFKTRLIKLVVRDNYNISDAVKIIAETNSPTHVLKQSIKHTNQLELDQSDLDQSDMDSGLKKKAMLTTFVESKSRPDQITLLEKLEKENLLLKQQNKHFRNKIKAFSKKINKMRNKLEVVSSPDFSGVNVSFASIKCSPVLLKDLAGSFRK